MRIVSGKYRGKKLKEFELETTKPTLDRVKESIFNLIQFDVQDAVVLDLFAGTGALGIEAISRGASKVFLVDSNKNAIKIINENLKGIEGDFEVYNKDYLKFLEEITAKFDIVLLDPPYNTDYGVDAIKMLIKKNLMSDNSIIIFETSLDKDVELDFKEFNIVKKHYGTVAVYKMERVWNILKLKMK